MAAVSLFWDTNMAGMTSSENTLLVKSTGYKLVPGASLLVPLRDPGNEVGLALSGRVSVSCESRLLMYDKLYHKMLRVLLDLNLSLFANHKQGLSQSYLHAACIGPAAVVYYQTAENSRRTLRQTRPSRDTSELFRREEPQYASLFCPF